MYIDILNRCLRRQRNAEIPVIPGRQIGISSSHRAGKLLV